MYQGRTLAHRLSRGSLTGIAMSGAILAAVVGSALPTSAASATDPTVTAAYAATIGGPGHAAMYPSGMEIVPTNATTIAAGIAGNVVIADTGNDQVAMYTTGGTQVWRGGAEGNAAPCGAKPTTFPDFEQPRDVGVDTSGNVYVADNGNGRILKLSGTTGKCLVKPFKMPGGGAPIGVTVSTTPAGQLVYVANGTKSQVIVFNTSGVVVRTIVSNGACTLNRMRDAAADASGNVYVANYTSNNILEFNANGTCITTFGKKGNKTTSGVCSGNVGGTFKNPYGVAIGTDPYIKSGSPGEAIYVADSNDDCIQEFTPSGVFVADMGSPGTTAGTFTQLRRVAVDANGNVWGADLWGYRVEEFTRSPFGYSYAQTIPNPVVPPGNTDTSVFNQVRGISFDAAGDVIAMDSVNQRVDVFTSSGTLINMCGQRGFTSTGDFNWPRGVAVDPATGNYWIADTKQSDLQILQPLASGCNGLAEFGVVGTPLGDDNYPYSIAIGNGYAWIADTKNNRVESWSVAGSTPPNVPDPISVFGTKGTGSGQFQTPAGIGVDPTSGNLFVADSVNNRVVEMTVNNGTVTGTAATITDGFKLPYGVASNGAGLLAVADRNNNRVVIINESDGSQAAVITAGDVTGGGPTTLFNPENVAFGPNGQLYIADTYNDRILVYALTVSS
jgi:DNA-binding beta-propeller fold protein YncE